MSIEFEKELGTQSFDNIVDYTLQSIIQKDAGISNINPGSVLRTLVEVFSENEDTANYYEVLQTLYPHIRAEDEDIIWGDDVHIIALQRFFIEPEYRGMGIGKFIAENLAKVIFEATNIKSLYCVGVLVPDDGTSATREIQRKTMEGADFCVIEDWDAEYIFGKCIYDEDIM